ncbi:sensor histidine kinase [Arthrobacter bambusae]|uniref:sensor histidine kinase n=1 Tax=Arthrobacter bambusae TaxID=1338426 RepID=UPI00278360F1|nr:ATP-binding protein [Arthrobacter bambusae]MDQ0029547.1 hypothetical protein [Arthrobacter bambusae]MDQ0097207.1 hypothetical protein [Arthrobacter bambusae]
MRATRGFWRTRRPGLVSKYGTLLGLSITIASSLFLAAASRLQPWEFLGAYLVLAGVLVCFALMLHSDEWPRRLAILLGLILLAELLGPEQRDEFSPAFIPYTLVLSASSVLVLSMRKTWRSMLFTFAAFLLVLGYGVVSAMLVGAGPASASLLTAAWIITLTMRLGGPRALAVYWGGFAVRQESVAAHIVAQDRRSTVAWNARHLHDTALRTLTVIGRQGAGVSSTELKEMLKACTTSPGKTSRQGPPPPGRTGVDFRASTPRHSPESGDLAVRLLRIAENRTRTGFLVEIHGSAGPVTESVQAALLAAVDECILNADRHAGAGTVDVLLSRSSDHVLVVVSDSGCGFDPSSLPTDRLGVKESVLARMRDAGGRARVFSTPGRGTTVLLEAVAA